MRIVECPQCGADISETYEEADESVGIMSGGWFCDDCGIAVDAEDDDDESDFEAGLVKL